MKEWLNKLPDWAVRAIKTFVQTFGGVVVPELVFILNGGWPESWAKFWGVLAPVIASALAAAICAAWNIVLEQLKSKEARKND